MTIVSAQRLARIFVEVADTLIDEFDLLDFMHLLVTRAASLIPGSTVGLLLTDQHDELRFMAASDENTRLLELFQVQNQEGPCMDAFRTTQPVINADLRQATARWPLFAPRAVAAGYRSVHAFPLRLRREVIGALNIFGSTPGITFDAADAQIMQALADIAAISLLQERSIHRGEILTEQLQGALNKPDHHRTSQGTDRPDPRHHHRRGVRPDPRLRPPTQPAPRRCRHHRRHRPDPALRPIDDRFLGVSGWSN